jgi:hypothetical protein
MALWLPMAFTIAIGVAIVPNHCHHVQQQQQQQLQQQKQQQPTTIIPARDPKQQHVYTHIT